MLVALLALVALAGAVFAIEIAAAHAVRDRDRATERAMALAREALVAYAAQRALDDGVGPGRLPCPDGDDDGWAEPTCGSLSGEVGQEARLGRLPWKTLGLPDLRDGDGERLWYAVSTRYKGLLNCAASAACVDLTPDTGLGTITVRDPAGRIVHDGTRADPYAAQAGGAVAVVLAPGPAIVRVDGHAQHRECSAPACDATGRCVASPPRSAPRCDPRNYLDATAFEDNARFVDRSDAAGRPGNADGFVAGPAADAGGALAVYDRILAIGYDDVMPAVMSRVAAEVARCLREYGRAVGHGGRLPWAAPSCGPPQDARGVTFGRLPSPPFEASRATDASLSATWTAACPLARPEGAWFARWRPFVFYALAERARPDALPGAPCAEHGCLAIVDASGAPSATSRDFAVAVAGAPLALGPVAQRHDRAGPANWLETPHVPEARADEGCDLRSPGTFVRSPRSPRFNDVVVAGP